MDASIGNTGSCGIGNRKAQSLRERGLSACGCKTESKAKLIEPATLVSRDRNSVEAEAGQSAGVRQPASKGHRWPLNRNCKTRVHLNGCGHVGTVLGQRNRSDGLTVVC